MPYQTIQFSPYGDGIKLELDEDRNDGKTVFAPGENCWIKLLPTGLKPEIWSSFGQATLISENVPATIDEEYVIFGYTNTASTKYNISHLLSYSWVGRVDPYPGKPKFKDNVITFKDPCIGVLKVQYRYHFDRIKLYCQDEVGAQIFVGAKKEAAFGYLIVTYSPGAKRLCNLTVRDACSMTIIQGARISVDGIFKGLTDSSGRISLGELSVGIHSLDMKKSGYQNSGEDTLANDSFSVSGETS